MRWSGSTPRWCALGSCPSSFASRWKGCATLWRRPGRQPRRLSVAACGEEGGVVHSKFPHSPALFLIHSYVAESGLCLLAFIRCGNEAGYRAAPCACDARSVQDFLCTVPEAITTHAEGSPVLDLPAHPMRKLTVANAFNQHFRQKVPPPRPPAEVRDLGGGRYIATYGSHEVDFEIPSTATTDQELRNATQSPAARLVHKVLGGP